MAILTELEEEASSSGGSGYSSYDVFLSFRGEDTRTTFTDRLYNALVQARIDTFRDDDEIGKGESLKPKLEKAIKESRASIIVLSKNYASSTWCLDELLLILECRRTSHHFVLPVFYGVDPSDVRKQKGSFAEAFRKHDAEQVGVGKQYEWRDALREVANLTGMVFKNQVDGDESQFIKDIVREIDRKLDRKVLSNPKHLVGMESRVRDINSWIRDGASEVVVLVICGMGGIGKTTLSKHIYNSNFRGFECRIFLANIREMSEQPNGLLGLQKQLLSSIQNGWVPTIDNIDEATAKIENALLRKRVLLLLDDVDEAYQIHALLGTEPRFHPGSKIIVTTRNKLLPKIINGPCQEHTLEELNEYESLELLSWHAFGLDHPMKDYEEQSKELAKHCGGIPLALEVLGSSLRGSGIDEWKSTSKLLKKENNSRIQKILRISYDSLQYDNDKELFLHIACFFVGMDKDYVVKILDFDFSTTSAIQNLVNRCLLDVGGSNTLEMHGLLQEMGREIVRQESPKNPGERSRLWCHEDSFNVLKEEKATGTIEGLMLDMEMLKEKNLPNLQVNSHENSYFNLFNFWSVDVTQSSPRKEELKTDAFKRMDKLALLKLNYARLSGTYKNFPRKLRWLCWHGFPLKSIPFELPMENMVALDMSFSKLEYVWTARKLLGSLKILDLSYSVELLRTPDFSVVTNLETLRLTGCTSLVEICESIGNLERLVVLHLEGCVNLKKLPRSIGMLKSLERLFIQGCSSLGEFPSEMVDIKTLKELHADRIGINSAGETPELKWWHRFVGSPKARLRSPQLSLTSLPRSLVILSLADSNLFSESFPSDLSGLSSLKRLDLKENPIDTLPICVRSLDSLESLRLRNCWRLKWIPCLPRAIKYLDTGNCDLLEKVRLYSPQSRVPFISIPSVGKLFDIQDLFKLQPIERVDKNILNTLGLSNLDPSQYLDVLLNDIIVPEAKKKRPLQVLYEFGIFSTFLHGKEVPTWFDYKGDETSISFSVPLTSPNNQRIRGLNVASVYRLSGKVEEWVPHPLFTKVTNDTQGLVWIYKPFVYGVPEGDGGIVWLSHWTFGNQLNEGDEVTVSVVVGDGLEVTEFGISVAYYDMQEEKDDEVGQNDPMEEYRWKEVIGGDLSAFQLSSGAYFLCHNGFLRDCRELQMSMRDDWTKTAWFRNLAGDSIQFEDVKHWGDLGRPEEWGRHKPQFY